MYSFPGMKKVLELTLEQTSESPGMFASGDHLSGSAHSIPPRQLCCIPDYLLDATVDYREGKQYYGASLFDEAQSKFADAITVIAMNDPTYMQENDFFTPLTSAIVRFMNAKCEQSMEKEFNDNNSFNSRDRSWFNFATAASTIGQLFMEQPDENDTRSINNSSKGNLEKFMSEKSSLSKTNSGNFTKMRPDSVELIVSALKNQEQPLPDCSDRRGSERRVYLPNDVLQRVICVMLTEIVMALALCHQMKEESQDYDDLFKVSNRLHTILYGEDTLKCLISSGNLERLCSIHSMDDDNNHHYDNSLPHVYIYQSNNTSNNDFGDFEIGICEILD